MPPTLFLFRAIWFLFFNTQVILGVVLLFLIPTDSLAESLGAVGDGISGVAGLLWLLGWFAPRWTTSFRSAKKTQTERAFTPFLIQLLTFEMVGVLGILAGTLNSKEIGIGLISAALLGIALCYPTPSRVERLGGLD